MEITGYTLEYTHEQTDTNDTQTSSFTISGLPALDPNEVYIINYSALPHLETVNSIMAILRRLILLPPKIISDGNGRCKRGYQQADAAKGGRY